MNLNVFSEGPLKILRNMQNKSSSDRTKDEKEQQTYFFADIEINFPMKSRVVLSEIST